MILIPILIFLVLIFAKTQKGLFACLLVLVATKSIIDAFWEYQIGPLSVMSVQGVLIPALFFSIFRQKKIIPAIWLRTAKVYVIALSLGLIWAIAFEPIYTVEIIVLNINIFLGFFLIPILVSDKERLRQFLIAIMICGVFPVLVSMFQLQTGIMFRERDTVGLARYVGFYHDGFPVRFYGLMTMFSILVYQAVFKTSNLYFRVFLATLAIGAALSVYLAFSKAAVGIVLFWAMLILFFSDARIKQTISILVVLSALLLVFGDVVYDNIEQLFSKEVGYQSGEVQDAKYTLAGRGYIWEKHWNFWLNKQTVFFQWLGEGIDKPVHNEFLRILLLNGIIGLFFFIIFLLRMISHTLRLYKKIKLFGMMLLGMYVFDCIGLVPGRYYYYNMLVWGIFGTLLLSPHLFIKSKTI